MATLTQTVQHLYESFGRGDIAAIVDTFAEDIRFSHAGGPDLPYAKERRGKAEAATFFADLAECVDVTLFEPRQYVEQGDSVVALGRWGGRARPSGRAFESEWAMLWTFEGSKVKVYRAYENTLAVAKAFGG